MIIKVSSGNSLPSKKEEVKTREQLVKKPENKNKKKVNKPVKEFIEKEEDIQKTFNVEDYLAD